MHSAAATAMLLLPEGAEAFLKDFLPTLLCVRMSDIHKAWQAASMKHFALFYAAGCYAPQLCFASVPLTIVYTLLPLS